MSDNKQKLIDVWLIADDKSTLNNPKFTSSEEQLTNILGDNGKIHNINKEGVALVEAYNSSIIDTIKSQDFVEQFPVPGNNPAVSLHSSETAQKEPDSCCSLGLTT